MRNDTVKKVPLRVYTVLFVLILAAMACNLPGQTEQPSENQPQGLTQQAQPVSEETPVSPAPTNPAQSTIQALPRPTRPEDQAGLPKPSIPVPPAHTTREPQAQTLPQQQEQQPAQNNSGESGSFYIVNDSSALVICYFYMAFSVEPEWGPDRLGENNVINPGENFTLTEVPHGTFDAQALDCDGNLLADVYGFDFPPNDTFTLFD